MNKTMQAILQALSYGGIEVESARWIADLKKLDPMRIFVKKLDIEVYNEEYKVPIRLYFADESTAAAGRRRAWRHMTGSVPGWRSLPGSS